MSPGRPHQPYSAWRDSTHAQQPDRIPIYMASASASLRCEAPAGSKGSFSRRRNAPYIFLHRAGAIRVAGRQLPNAMLNEVYNSRILRACRQHSPAGKAERRCHGNRSFKLCGSTVTVDLKMEGDTVTDFSHDVKACALGQASSSIMARHVIGAKADELRSLRETVRRMLKENGAPPSGKWADIAVLEPVRDYKARHASTLLTFDAVTAAIDQINQAAGGIGS